MAYSVNAVLQSLAAKLDHYFKVSTDALAVPKTKKGN